jgi:hypothetical protein
MKNRWSCLLRMALTASDIVYAVTIGQLLLVVAGILKVKAWVAPKPEREKVAIEIKIVPEHLVNWEFWWYWSPESGLANMTPCVNLRNMVGRYGFFISESTTH